MLLSAFDLGRPHESTIAGEASYRGLTVGLGQAGRELEALPENGSQLDWATLLSTPPDALPSDMSGQLIIPERGIVAVGGPRQSFHYVSPTENPPSSAVVEEAQRRLSEHGAAMVG